MQLNYNQAITSNFRIEIPRLPQLELYATDVNIPGVTLDAIEKPYQDVRIKLPDNKYTWDDLNISFILDEDLYVYELIRKWNEKVRNTEMWQDGLYDINIIPLDSNKNINYKFSLEGAFPTMIGGWQYTTGSTSTTFLTFDVSFAFQHFGFKREKELDFSF